MAEVLEVIGLWAIVATVAALVLGKVLAVAERRELERRGRATAPSPSMLPQVPAPQAPLDPPAPAVPPPLAS